MNRNLTNARWRRAAISLTIALCTAGSAVAGVLSDSERAVLTAIYTQTNGHTWKISHNWRGTPPADDPFEVDECTWWGVTCDQDVLGGPIPRVIKLDLSNNYLAGTLPALDALPMLVTLDFSRNNGVIESTGPLTGPIPALTGLIHLQSFNGYLSKFTGSIPSLSGLTALRDFDVSDNQLSGALPSLSGLVSLETFSANNQTYPPVSGNRLTGGIPALTGLTLLKGFSVNGNLLSGAIPSLTGLGNLQGIVVSDNNLSGSIPSLSGLAGLGAFVAFNNQLTGAIPSLAGAPNLTTFHVGNNQLTGSIPPISGLTLLRSFHVERNLLTGSLPAFTNIGALAGFYAGHNQLTGPLPSLASAFNLGELNVSYNSLSGTLPTLRVAATSQMVALHLDHNLFSGALPAPPQFLANGMSTICPNPFTPLSPSTAWNVATGVTPWWATPTAASGCDEPAASAVTVVKAGSGGGTVTASAGAINCGATCTGNYAATTAITLTATPAGGNQFTGWLGPCTGSGACTFTPTGTTTVIATFAAAPVGPKILSIDGNASYNALTDGLLAMRYLFGLSGPSLTANAIGPDATRSTATAVGDYLADIKPLLDIDGNGQADALTDGLLIIRYLFGLRGSSLIAGAVGTNATRISPEAIIAQLQSLMP